VRAWATELGAETTVKLSHEVNCAMRGEREVVRFGYWIHHVCYAMHAPRCLLCSKCYKQVSIKLWCPSLDNCEEHPKVLEKNQGRVPYVCR
jgi:hypothetical protein